MWNTLIWNYCKFLGEGVLWWGSSNKGLFICADQMPWISIWHMYVPQDMESDEDTVYYDTAYSNDGYTPELQSVGHGWKLTY